MKIIQHPDGNQSVEATPEEIEKMENLLETRPDKLTPEATAQMLRLIGDAYFTAGDRRRAVEWYARFVATGPSVPDGFIERVESLLTEFPDLQNAGAATVLGDRMMSRHEEEEANPEAEVAYEAGVRYAEAGDWSSAVVSFERALARQPNHYWAAHNLGAAYAELGDEAHALTWLRRAIGIDPQIPSGHYNLGLLLLRTDNPPLAVEALERCFELDPSYPGLDPVLGEAYFKVEDYESACTALKRAASRGQADPEALVALGQSHEALGQLGDAARAYRGALDLNPQYREALQLLKSIQGRLH